MAFGNGSIGGGSSGVSRLDTSLNGTPPGGGYGNGSSASRNPATSLGLTTPATWFGNTAFGPAGGMAAGFASMAPQMGPVDSGSSSFANPGVGQGLGQGTYSNFRTPSGGNMFGGSLQNQPVNARNAIQALQMLRAMQAGQARPQARPPGGPRARPPGLLDDEVIFDVEDVPPNLSVEEEYPNAWRIQRPQDMPWPGQNTLRNRANNYGLGYGPRPIGTKLVPKQNLPAVANPPRYTPGPRPQGNGGIPGFSANGNLGTSWGPSNDSRNSWGYGR